MALQLSSPSKKERIDCLSELQHHANIKTNLVAILVRIENVPATITDYREKERLQDNLLRILIEAENIDSEYSQRCAFHHLLGTLYINFEKFWGPTVRVINEVLNQTRFRDILLDDLLQHLVDTNRYIYNAELRANPLFVEFKPDFVLHRNFIFQIFSKHVKYIEKNNRLFFQEVFTFLGNEINKPPFVERSKGVDLTKTKEPTDYRDDGPSFDDDSNARQSSNNQNNQSQVIYQSNSKKSRKSRKRSWTLKNPRRPVTTNILEARKSRETLVTLSRIIQNISKIEDVHGSAELKTMILELLCCRDISVQRAAFNCLLAYNIESVIPYVESIRKLLDVKQLRSELSVFSIDADEGHQIMVKHRPHLIPIIQRIIYGRMISSLGKKASGRDKAIKRKDFVMRFMSGCTDEEVVSFFGLLFKPLYKYLDIPMNHLYEKLITAIDISNFIPLNKMSAMLQSIESFMKHMGHSKDSLLIYCLKLINIITFTVAKTLETPGMIEKISPRNSNQLKEIKRSCVRLLTQFFVTFQYYEFSQDEMDFIFQHLVWPSCRNFVNRNHASVTPTLKLIQSFATTRVFHNLLIKRNKSNEGEFLLEHLATLYSDAKTSRDVVKTIGSILADLIEPDREYPDTSEIQVEPPQYCDKDCRLPEYNSDSYNSTGADIPRNHRMMLCYIPIIFERLNSTCQVFISKKDTNYLFDSSELLLLSTLSVYIKESQHCILATRLLLSSMNHVKQHGLVIKTLIAVQNLIEQATGPADSEIIGHIANTLYFQHNQEQRAQLCKIIALIASKDDNLKICDRIIQDMNALSVQFVDSPDLVRLNQGFHEAFKYFESMTDDELNNPGKTQNSMILLVHQLGYIIESAEKYEFSVRDNCLVFFEKFAQRLRSIDKESNQQFLNVVLDEVIIEKMIKKGLRSTNDMIKHLYLGIVRILALNCHSLNEVIREFSMFCHVNQDLDFWFNIKHIQLHNRSKALARLVNDENLLKVRSKTLSAFFLPLVSGFLFNRNFRSLASLIDNSIKIIGIICRNLNWSTYESTLSYYLGLLTNANTAYQKTSIKLITEILRNFNFDLTLCTEATAYKDEDEKLAQRMRRRLGSLGYEVELSPGNDKKTKLNASTAKMVYNIVMKRLIPRLNASLHEMTRVEFEHDKKMADYMPEKDEIKRIPVAFAIVQLLNLLPCKYILLRDHLPQLFLKLVTFLKSKNEQTRKAARATLNRIMKFVGPVYLIDLLRILRQNLDKGFYIHVLNYTTCSVLENIELDYGDLDSISHSLVEMCMQEIFGRPAEDKEIAQILAKTSEAKKTRSYDTLQILASYISDEKLESILAPVKGQLKTANDSKTVNKLSVCLQRIFNGLSQNKQFPLSRMFDFIQKTIADSVPSLKVHQRIDISDQPSESVPIREDRFLIKKEKTKDRLKSKINERGNLHLMVDNALRLLLATFEKYKLQIKENQELQQKLDGFIPLLATCLKSTSPRCVTRSLKCIFFVAKTKIDLPIFKAKCNSLVKKIFILLNLYNGVGMVKGDNSEMIGMCFKTLALLLLRCEHANLTEDQIRALMSYIEQDLSDPTRQATAFKTLYSLVQRKYDCPELTGILDKVAETLVTSSDDSLRDSSIKIWQSYLLQYKLEKDRLQVYLNKFLRQLEYDYIDGRKSVLQMLRAIVEKFPEKILRDHFDLFFYLLAQRIVNDESKEIRELVGRLISLIVRRLPDKQVFVLNKFVLSWANCNNLDLNILGIKLVSVLMETCEDHFVRNKERLDKLLLIVLKSLSQQGSISESETNGELREASNGTELTKNKLSYHSLRMFERMITKKIITPTDYKHLDKLKMIWQIIAEDMLKHRYEPVCHTACTLYIYFINSTYICEALKVDQPKKDNYIECNATKIVIALCDKFIDLINTLEPSSRTYKYVAQGLVQLGQAVSQSHATLNFEDCYSRSFVDKSLVDYILDLDDIPKDGFIAEKLPYTYNDAKKKATLMWLLTKIVMQARRETALFRSTQCRIREFVLGWLAIVAQELGTARVHFYIFLIMTIPTRELTDKDKNKASKDSPQRKLVPMSEDLLRFLKSLLGVELFNKVYAKVQLHFTKRRVERKKTEAILRVKDQKRGIKRKQTSLKDKRVKKCKNQAKHKTKRLAPDRDIRQKRICSS